MNKPKRILILYGSQTFTAQEIAERIWRNTKILGFSGPVMAMDDYPIVRFRKEDIVILVCATTGQGDVPDNMKKFWRFLLRRNLPPDCLTKLRFGVLALGDSSYSKFNFAGRMLNKRLLQLGAESMLNIGLCDYQHELGHDGVAIPWIKECFKCLKSYFPNIPTDDLKTAFVPRWKVSLIKISGEPQQCKLEKDIYYETGWKDPFHTAIHLELENNVRTTTKSHFQDVRLMTFRTLDKGKLEYNPGDVFNIRPRNSPEDVEDLFSIFETHGIDIKPHYKLKVEKHYDGPERVAVIGGVSGGANTLNSQDDEYRFAGVEDPKIMITTSREPSARLKMFVKELRLLFPNSQRMNRGGYEMSQLIHACRANDVTDFIVVHEHRGVPDSLVICHLPYGPTASFTLSGVVMRHDIPDIGPMSEQYPHLIFHNFKSDLDLPVPEFLKNPLTLYDIAKSYWDLKAYPTQYFFSLLALVAEDKLEKEKCIELSSPNGQEEWLNYSRRPKRTPLEVLHDFHKTTSKLTIEILFELFSTIKPRSFSIASSVLMCDTRLDILVAVVEYNTIIKKPRLGLASNWLKRLKPADRLYGWVKKGTFKFPSHTIPSIMVGPGTGLAPFRSLLQQRMCTGTLDKDRHHLFFGCRYRQADFHCSRELLAMVDEGQLTLYCAFSRDQDKKVYVQHKISEHADLLWRLINDQNAYIFVSGNAKSMPDEVKKVFLEICGRGGGDAGELLEKFQNSNRYQVETW